MKKKLSGKGKIYIGTSGWSYGYWRGPFYPELLSPKEYLSFYSQHFDAGEINSTFYHMPLLKTVETWAENVPKSFKFCPKMSRYLTHLKKLNEPEEPLSRFIQMLGPIKKNLGPILIQLPASLKFNPAIAEPLFYLLKITYKDYPFAIEPRHPTWFEKESINLITESAVAFVISESGGRFVYKEIITTQNIYVRFHGPTKLYDSSYSDKTLKEYASKFKSWMAVGHKVWVFFNNTMHQDALNNAKKLKEFLSQAVAHV